MKTECSDDRFSCKFLGRRGVVARFDGGDITSDGGAILLRELEAKTGIIRRFAACFTDHRDPDRIEHTVGELVARARLRAGARLRGPERPRRAAPGPNARGARGEDGPQG